MLQKRKKMLLLCALLAAVLLVGCGGGTGTTPEVPAGPTELSADFFAMDTLMSFRIYDGDEALIQQCRTLVEDLENELSVVKEGSAVWQLNHSGSAALSDTAADLLGRTLSLCEETGGTLDVSVYPIVRAWGFTETAADDTNRVPSSETVRLLLEKVDYRRIRLEGNTASLPDGTEIDLGAVAKGYAGELLAADLRKAGVKSAVLALGGNIQTVGSRPDGSAWRVGVQSPDKDGLLGVLSVSDLAVVTSGGYERYFTDPDGNVWWHIMDPQTGYPARNGLVSVTVIGRSGLACDALSTALFIMGPDQAVSYWRAHRDFDMLLVTDDARLLATAGAAALFEPDENLSCTFEVIGDD